MVEEILPDKINGHCPNMDTMSVNGRSAPASGGLRILLVDDNSEVARALRITFEVAGHRIDIADAPEQAFSHLASRSYDAVLLDLNFTPGHTGGEEGLACLSRMIANDPDICVVVITAHSGIRLAVTAMQAGARDFIMKPWRNSELVAKVEAAVARRGVTAETRPGNFPKAALILGESPAIDRVRALVHRLGPTMAAVAITGPSGAGRTLVAEALHAASAFAGTPPVHFDVRAENEWPKLDGVAGTVVLRHLDRLDEIGRTRLLNRLSDSARPIFIVEGMAQLTPAITSRITVIEIAVPPLKARGHDAVLLARHFLRTAAERHRLAAPRFTPAAERYLREAAWAGEVRGLAIAIERALLLEPVAEIDVAALALPSSTEDSGSSAVVPFDLAENEKAVIAAALREHGHNITQAATALGLSRGALYRRLERHGL